MKKNQYFSFFDILRLLGERKNDSYQSEILQASFIHQLATFPKQANSISKKSVFTT